MKIWFIEQLLDTRGKELFTWQQLRKLLEMKLSGKKARWFKAIEEHLLEPGSRRHIREAFQKDKYNSFAPEMQLKRPSTKISRKEWVLGEINKENEYIIGKIQKKRKMSSDISPCLRTNKTALNTSSERNCKLEQPGENSSIRIKNTSMYDISE